MIELTQGQKDFLHVSVLPRGAWSINPVNGFIDVDGSVDIPERMVTLPKYEKLPISFGRVRDNFDAGKYLKTLEGAPLWVGGAFVAWNCRLERLNWMPEYIGENIALSAQFVEYEHMGDFIFDIDELLNNGFELYAPGNFYYPYREAYYERKMIESI